MEPWIVFFCKLLECGDKSQRHFPSEMGESVPGGR